MAETEKITINVNVVDLGKIDLLVEQGFYSNRTDFIKSSIRSELSEHADTVDRIISDKKLLLGVSYYSKKDLDEVVASKKALDIKVIGMLVIADDVDPELVRKSIHSLKVLGVLRASTDVRKALDELK
ncbi:CopG family transcriptional regulator [Ornithinibacillus halotolerans]|uniref:CopG family transcriptional regulator n=1 Tax=Ornithinibacillus halotolerans TaxID=1274357 RepID=A0A916S311_9BACI|nr:CopG family transcriptional regulator [Ornithinibacillus halotolerans]GGA81486.1 CopG family transcriptional regulator [Ornithinibacillus halotolerans]